MSNHLSPSPGSAPETLQFFHELAKNNDREWFEQHKAVYENEVKQPMAALITALAEELARRGLPLTGDPKRSMFRIHRDVRFSNDKSPYKTQAGAVLSRDGTKDFQGLLYIHISPEGSFTASGFYHPDAGQLERCCGGQSRLLRNDSRKSNGRSQEVRLSRGRSEALQRLPRRL